MDDEHAEAIALHRWAVIAEATSDRLEPAQRGVLVRAIAGASPQPSRRHTASLQPGHVGPLDPGLASGRARGPAPAAAL